MSEVSSSGKQSQREKSGGADSAHVPTNDELMHGLMMVAKMVKGFSESKLSKHAEFEKLTPPRIGVLFVVHDARTLRMGDLAAKLCIAARSATDLVDGLERDGFIIRKADPTDRRAMLLELTESARKSMGRLAEFRTKLMQELFSNFEPDERKVFLTLLNKIKDGPLSALVQELTCNHSAE